MRGLAFFLSSRNGDVGEVIGSTMRLVELEWTLSYIFQGQEEHMVIGDRLRELRAEKKLSQGDVEKRTGLLRCYISRVENGHTVPAIETLEKMARALEVPMYQLFYGGDEPPDIPNLLKPKTSDAVPWGSTGKNSIYMHKLVKCLSKSTDSDRKLLLALAQKVSGERSRRVSTAP